MNAAPRLTMPERLPDLLGSARFSAALTQCILGTAFLSHALRATTGWAGLVAILTGLVVLAAASLAAKRGDWEWRGLLPISLLVLVAWCAATLLWTAYQPDALGGVLYLTASAFLAVYVGVVRDLIQIVRAAGDVLRVVLVGSLALEVLAGLLIDGPIPFLGIRGALERLGPIQGLLGERNALGIVALVAAVTFAIELITRSVSRGRAVFSLATALLVASLTRSSVILGTFLVLAAAALAILGLRHLARQARPLANSAALVLAALVGVLVVVFRSPVLQVLQARPDYLQRVALWREMLRLIDLNTIEGWGFVGLWRRDAYPYTALDLVSRGAQETGRNAYLDLYLQAGLVGLVLFAAFCGLALGRSWVLATTKRGVGYVWTALVLVVLVVASLAESVTIVEWGWVLLVVCAVKAAQGRSWRHGLRQPEAAARDGAGPTAA